MPRCIHPQTAAAAETAASKSPNTPNLIMNIQHHSTRPAQEVETLTATSINNNKRDLPSLRHRSIARRRRANPIIGRLQHCNNPHRAQSQPQPRHTQAAHQDPTWSHNATTARPVPCHHLFSHQPDRHRSPPLPQHQAHSSSQPCNYHRPQLKQVHSIELNLINTTSPHSCTQHRIGQIRPASTEPLSSDNPTCSSSSSSCDYECTSPVSSASSSTTSSTCYYNHSHSSLESARNVNKSTLIKIKLDNKTIRLNITRLNANCRLCLAFMRYLSEQNCKIPSSIPIYI